MKNRICGVKGKRVSIKKGLPPNSVIKTQNKNCKGMSYAGMNKAEYRINDKSYKAGLYGSALQTDKISIFIPWEYLLLWF